MCGAGTPPDGRIRLLQGRRHHGKGGDLAETVDERARLPEAGAFQGVQQQVCLAAPHRSSQACQVRDHRIAVWCRQVPCRRAVHRDREASVHRPLHQLVSSFARHCSVLCLPVRRAESRRSSGTANFSIGRTSTNGTSHCSPARLTKKSTYATRRQASCSPPTDQLERIGKTILIANYSMFMRSAKISQDRRVILDSFRSPPVTLTRFPQRSRASTGD